MCLSKAYVESNGERELLFEEVTSLEVKDDRLLLKTLLGEQKEIEASIKEIDFLTHNIILASFIG
ncbi:CooT family nickel-binding protein [Chloroflexota bacterium]